MTDMQRWLRRCSGPRDPGARLICLPFAGAGAAVYADWALPATLAAEVWAVRLPGRENRWREEPLRELGSMVEGIAEAVSPMLDRTWVLFGHSMGALLAFELTRRFREAGARLPVHLFLSGAKAADLPPWRPPASNLSDEQLLDRLAIMRGPSRSTAVDRDVLLAMAPTIRADFATCESYAYRDAAPLDIPITGFAAADDPEVRVDEVGEWARHTCSRFALYTFTGGHLFLQDDAATVLDVIAANLAADIAAVRPGR